MRRDRTLNRFLSVSVIPQSLTFTSTAIKTAVLDNYVGSFQFQHLLAFSALTNDLLQSVDTVEQSQHTQQIRKIEFMPIADHEARQRRS